MIPTTIPHGRTARRLEWVHLPPHIRAAVEGHCGSPVVDAASQLAGFTPGFASVLTCADGRRHFVKAASVKAQRVFAAAYREEAHKLGRLPAEAPAPRLQWVHDRDDWLVLGIEYVEARAPRRPWDRADLGVALALTERVAEVLTPAPADLELADVADELGGWATHWDVVAQRQPDLPYLDAAAGLAAGATEVVAGDTVVHTDIRDDNILIRPDGTALLCDWNWPARGAAWLDTLFLLVGPRGDGIDVEAVLAEHPLTRDVPREHVDAVLALITGYLLRSAGEPRPPTSPYLRDAQAWQGAVCWQWLSERRGWS